MLGAEHDEHAWAEPRLELHRARLLDSNDEARVDRHVLTCTSCQDTLQAMSIPAPDAGSHVPASVLARWPHVAGSLPALERELIEQHLNECGPCREDLRIAGAVRTAPRARITRLSVERVWALAATAAALSIALAWWRSPADREPTQPASPVRVLRGEIAPGPVVLHDVLRGTGSASATIAEPRGREAVALELVPFEVSDDTPVVIEVVSPLGEVALRMLQTQGELYPHRQLVLGDSIAPLPDGDYVLRLIARPEGAPADTQSARFSVRRRP
ncbi:MAG: zf-HC2 domain-containing protein [Candidatus Eisenbacteria bacterium]